ncbi:MAG: glucose-1-phosphate adenylyltransferase subunit GlgD [Clostridia bacterium]|nr:glucose-1-phosphate adenylyltransferase subunit GlgD [Clostridia bacterium]
MENNNTLGLIFSGNPEVNLGELMKVRSLAAVPVGGRYRIVDFMLSNMVNSGIVNVGITTGTKHRSLSDHVGSGKAWDMARKTNGLFLIPPPETLDNNTRTLESIDFVNSAMSFLTRSRQDYVILSDCNTICSINFEDVIDKHFKNDADITVVYTEVGELTPKELGHHIMLDANADGSISDIQVYPQRQKTNLAYMNMMFIKKDLLIELVGDCLAHDKHSIAKDILLANLHKLRIFGYKFDGYKKTIDSIKSFFGFNLDLLDPNIRHELFGTNDARSIHTKVKDSVPTKYGREAEVKNSVIADGCTIEGRVENCIIFRGVKIGKNSVVKDAIIMQNSRIMDDCRVENAIFDKEVILCNGKKLIGQGTYPLVIGKRTIV